MAQSIGSDFLIASGQLTNAQIKSLHATPITIISAPGSGKLIQIVTATGLLNYGGTNIFTAGASQTINATYGTSVTAVTVLSNLSIVASQNSYNQRGPTLTTDIPFDSMTNQAITLYNSVATEITGNAANNNTVSFNIVYRIITIP